MFFCLYKYVHTGGIMMVVFVTAFEEDETKLLVFNLRTVVGIRMWSYAYFQCYLLIQNRVLKNRLSCQVFIAQTFVDVGGSSCFSPVQVRSKHHHKALRGCLYVYYTVCTRAALILWTGFVFGFGKGLASTG